MLDGMLLLNRRSRRNLTRVTTASAAAAALALPVPLPVGGHGRPHAAVVHVRTMQAHLCDDGWLIVWYALEKPARGGVWEFAQDDGTMTVQRQAPSGRWVPLPSRSGGEGIARVSPTDVKVAGIAPLDAVRVRHGRSGWTSSARLIGEECLKR